MRKLSVLAALAAAAFAGQASAAELIFSDFEDELPGRTSGFVVVDSADGWTKTADSAGIELQFGNTGGATADPGTNRVKVELDSTANSGMFFTIPEDGFFRLDFLFSPRPGEPAGTNIIEVLLDTALLGTFTGDGGSSTVWTDESLIFEAQAGQKLIFSAAGVSDSFGGYLDNIVVTSVPEPGTWALFILGLGLVGFSMRRRSKVSARISFA